VNQEENDRRGSILERHKSLAKQRILERVQRQQGRDTSQAESRQERWSEVDANRAQRMSERHAEQENRLNDRLAGATSDAQREKIEARLEAHMGRAAEINRAVAERRNERVSARQEKTQEKRSSVKDETRSRIRERVASARARRERGGDHAGM